LQRLVERRRRWPRARLFPGGGCASAAIMAFSAQTLCDIALPRRAGLPGIYAYVLLEFRRPPRIFLFLVRGAFAPRSLCLQAPCQASWHGSSSQSAPACCSAHPSARKGLSLAIISRPRSLPTAAHILAYPPRPLALGTALPAFLTSRKPARQEWVTASLASNDLLDRSRVSTVVMEHRPGLSPSGVPAQRA